MIEDAAPAEDGEDYEDEPEEAAAPGIAVIALAGAVTGAAGFAVGGPAGAVVANAATPFLAVVFQKTVNAITRDKSRRADMMLETAAGAAGLTPDELADRAGESEETRFLTDRALQAAADTIWPEGVRAIGRAYAAGLLATDKPVLDIRLRVLGIMTGLDELHISLLELLVRCEPDVQGNQYVAVPHRIDSYQNTYFAAADGPGNPKFWSAGRRHWNYAQTSAVRPHLQLVLGSLLGDLTQRGLAQEIDTAPEAAKQVGEDMARQVNRQAGQMDNGKRMRPITLQPATVQPPEPTWSPTELGEKVLGFYAEAGADDGQGHG